VADNIEAARVDPPEGRADAAGSLGGGDIRRTSRALIFPGQGSQYVGMGADLVAAFPRVRAVFDEVDEALGQDLSRLIFDGPETDLTHTENAQPALLAVSTALVRVLAGEFGWTVGDLAAYVAGHSLGEYSALVAAGSLSLADAARVLRRRGLAMQAAVPAGRGAMAALVGLDLAAARAVADEAVTGCADGEVCVAANDNAPGQVVISGTRGAVERAVSVAAAHGAKRSIFLQVSGPFHSPLMAPVREVVATALQAVPVLPAVPRLVSNFTAGEVSAPEEIRRALIDQVTGLVRWRETVVYLRSQGVDEFVEVGPGKVLTCLARRTDRRISATAIEKVMDVRAFVANLRRVPDAGSWRRSSTTD
jgi:[acyl-carrier-protein] S-malonyltransferase